MFAAYFLPVLAIQFATGLGTCGAYAAHYCYCEKCETWKERFKQEEKIMNDLRFFLVTRYEDNFEKLKESFKPSDVIAPNGNVMQEFKEQFLAAMGGLIQYSTLKDEWGPKDVENPESGWKYIFQKRWDGIETDFDGKTSETCEEWGDGDRILLCISHMYRIFEFYTGTLRNSSDAETNADCDELRDRMKNIIKDVQSWNKENHVDQALTFENYWGIPTDPIKVVVEQPDAGDCVGRAIDMSMGDD